MIRASKPSLEVGDLLSDRLSAIQSGGFSSDSSTPRPWRASGPRQRRRAQRKFGHPDQVAGRHDVLRGGVRALHPEVPTFSEAARGLRPTEDLLDFAAGTLAEPMRLRADFHCQGAPGQGRRMGHHPLAAQAFDKPAGTVTPISPDRPWAKTTLLQLGDLADGDLRLRGASGPDGPQRARTGRAGSPSWRGH